MQVSCAAVGLPQGARAGFWGLSPQRGQEEGELSAPSTGFSEEAPIRLFAEVTGRILSHRGELKRQLSAIAYWKTEEVLLLQGGCRGAFPDTSVTLPPPQG